ncbi:energy transducer TonB [Compostibacter hankyongensis]|uniref:TonB C-terminal domain-containing protein n=1 Tax=Compostibacter hankyongensis TaxID=1007089 RepID=A0ABP8FPF7_9BACT
MRSFEQQKNVKALGITVLVYGLVIVVCILVGFSAPPPLPNQDMGMEINLGNARDGSGTEQPLNPNPQSPTPVPAQPAEASPASSETGSRTEDVVTDDAEDAPAVIKKVPEEKKKPDVSKNINEEVKNKAKTPRPDAPVEPKPTRKPKAIYSGGTSSQASSGNSAGTSNDSRNEGLTSGQGDQGAVNGNPTAANHNGEFSGLGGNSLSYRLNGRHIVTYPSREGAFREPGRVRLSIKVDQQGNVTGYSIISADNPTISRLAEKKVKQIKFNVNPNAPVVQFGEIVFVFKIQQ